MSDLDPKGGTLKLYRGKSIHEGRTRYEDASRAVHMDAAGAYLTREKYLVLSRELPHPTDADRTIRIPVEPLVGARASATSQAGSPISNEALDLGSSVVEVEFGGLDTFMAISTRGIHRRNANGSWQTVYEEADAGRLNFRRLRYGNGVWLAAQGGDDATAGRVLRSTDGGDTWAPADDLAGVGRITFMERGPDSSWMLGVWRRLGPNSSQSTIYRSVDGGATWSGPRQEAAGAVFADAVYFNDRDIFIIQEFPASGYGLADASVGYTLDNYFAAYWRWVYWGLITRDSYRTWQLAHRVAKTNDGRMVVVSRNGNVSYTLGRPISTSDPAQMASAAFNRVSGISGLEPDGEVDVRDLAYDPVGEALIAVGGFTPTGEAAQARAWRSTNDGRSWERITDVESAFDAPIVTVAVDSSGNALYMNSTRWAMGGTRRGLEGGEYNVYVVSYFNTHAGKFVYDMHMEPLTTEDGGSISFRAPHKGAIFAANAVQPDGSGWMTDEHRPLLDDLRFDVYVQAVREPIGDEDVAYAIRYAFTEPFPEAPADPDVREVSVGRTLDALPLGRNLLSYGLPTTAVFEKRHTALHGGRVWGMAAQDESRWSKDPASPEVANQAQRFVLSYSEVGWANLMGDRSFIVIQPTQSTRFTGLLSTPSGLLVMFENEIHLVTGDPAFGNVSVELYLDMVGCDPDTHPCKVGGVPFTIWNGKLWVLQAGQAQQIGAEQWLASDPFVRVSPEPQTRSLLALTKSGLVFRYMLDDQFWLTDPVTRHGDAVVELFTNCACESGDNTRFMLANGELWCTRSDREPTDSSPAVPPDAPHVLYQDIDFGALDSRSSLYLVKVGLEGPLLQQQFDRGAVDFDADALPALFYLAANEGQAAALQEVDPVVTGGRVPYLRANLRGSNTVTWRLPLGRTKGSSIDVRLELRGFSYDDVLKLPLQLFFARGGVVR